MKRWIVAAVAGALLLGGAAPARAATAPRPLSGDGAWSWFGEPRAVYHEGAHRRTYAGWVTSAGDIEVASYDHDSHRTQVAVVAPRFQVDDHASPALYVRRDGRIAVFWSAHDGPLLHQAVTLAPEDVGAWTPARVVPTNTPGDGGYTYPNPVRLDAENGRLWLFWRGGNRQPTYSTSGDEGATWAPARTLIEVPGQRPYVTYAASGGDTIHLAFDEGNPGAFHTSLYYAAYRGGRLLRADGTEIADLADAPIDPGQADRVYDATGGPRAWVHDVAADAAGRPVIVYAVVAYATGHRYRYARWTGSEWVDRDLTPAGGSFSTDGANPHYSGGIALDHEDPSVVWLSREVDGRHALERWRTPDGGATWSAEAVAAGSALDDVRPVTPRGLPAGAQTDVLWMRGEYAGYTAFRTSIMSLLGEPPAPEALAASAGAAPARPAAATARRATRVRIAVRTRRTRRGAVARVSGALLERVTRRAAPGRRVTLEARRRGARRFHRVGTLVTSRTGRVARSRALTAATDYRLCFRGDAALTPTVSRVARARRRGRD